MENKSENEKWRRKTEDWVRGYHFYKNQLKLLPEIVLLSTPVYDNNGGGKSNLPSRPTEKKVMELSKLEKVLKIYEKRVAAVDTAMNELNKNQQRLIHRIYWSGAKESVIVICSDLKIAESSYHRWNKEFLKRVWGLLKGD